LIKRFEKSKEYEFANIIVSGEKVFNWMEMKCMFLKYDYSYKLKYYGWLKLQFKFYRD